MPRIERRYNTIELIELEKQGLSLTAIGEHFGITRERARQIYNIYLGRPKTKQKPGRKPSK
jgi:DNA-directed RNA polymerase sigma subunit (sigma70/sigma32)